MKPMWRAEWVVLSENLCILASCFLSPMSRNSILEELRDKFRQWKGRPPRTATKCFCLFCLCLLYYAGLTKLPTLLRQVRSSQHLLNSCFILFLRHGSLMFYCAVQIQLICRGQTTYEVSGGIQRYRHDDVTSNLRTVFGPYWMVNFLWPLRTLPDGDGIFWQMQKTIKNS